MNMNEYQKRTDRTVVYEKQSYIIAQTYTALGLCNESGDYAGKIKKWLRGDKPISKEDLVSELGDILWYVAQCASNLGVDLEDVALKNLAKLEDRKQRDVLKGDGDDR